MDYVVVEFNGLPPTETSIRNWEAALGRVGTVEAKKVNLGDPSAVAQAVIEAISAAGDSLK